MSFEVNLKLDWCSHEAAKYAVERWHYSGRMPKSKLAKIGAWESGNFIGALVFGVGGVPGMYSRYRIKDEEGCELVRIALRQHVSTVTRMVSISLRMLRQAFSGLKLVVSYADTEIGHLGTIYQAGGWIYTGLSQSSDEYHFQGRRWHGRAFRHRFKGLEHSPAVTIIKGSNKHRYLMPLDAEMRARILPLAKPYPKRATSETIDTSGHQPEKGGAAPTVALQI